MTAAHAMGLEIGVDYDEGRAVVTVAGEVDVYSAAGLREELTALDAAGHHRLAIDLSAMKFCDSTGLGVLVGAFKRAAGAGGGICLFGAPEHFLKVLRISGLTKVLPVFADRAEALGWLAAQ